MTTTEAGELLLSRRRACTLVTALAFFVGAYVAGIMLRPRTSTWVACGAIVSLMVLPLLAVVFLLPSGSLAMMPSAAAEYHLTAFDARFATYGRFFHMLEISPFTLAAVAISAALAGDWLARALLLRASRRRPETFRPL